MEVIRLPPMSPNLNAYSERFVRSIKDGCLGRMIFVGQASLRRAIGEYMAHYHEERNHQGLNNTLIRAEPRDATNDAFIAGNGSAECSTITTVRQREVLDRVIGNCGFTCPTSRPATRAVSPILERPAPIFYIRRGQIR